MLPQEREREAAARTWLLGSAAGLIASSVAIVVLIRIPHDRS
jgi:hypothetical protein